MAICKKNNTPWTSFEFLFDDNQENNFQFK